MTTTVLNISEFVIEQVQSSILIIDNTKRYIPMFRYENSHWCYMLPIKTMYLCTISESKKLIQESIIDSNTKKLKCEYKIAEIIN